MTKLLTFQDVEKRGVARIWTYLEKGTRELRKPSPQFPLYVHKLEILGFDLAGIRIRGTDMNSTQQYAAYLTPQMLVFITADTKWANKWVSEPVQVAFQNLYWDEI